MTLLAASAGDSAARGEWITEFGFFLVVAIQIVMLVKQFTSQKRVVSFSDRYASSEDLGHLRDEVDDLSGDVESMRKEFRIGEGQLHEKINAMAKSVSSQEGKQELMNQRIVQMDSKLDRFIERNSKS